MNLAEHYDELYENAVQKFLSGAYAIDQLIDDRLDQRRGVTLLVRPSGELVQRIGSFIQDLKIVEPDQYYQPDTDMHMTVLSIISCYEWTWGYLYT